MPHSSYPFPPFIPLTRLQAKENLRIDAERWALAHNYHRQRQNLHYQALWEPGIVCGLGVKVIAPPATIRSQFRDGRWLEIQPGIAIDVAGNPIIVSPEPAENRTYHLATPDPIKDPMTVHLVLSYVDPESLELPEREVQVIEQFRIDERIRSLATQDIELCRIQLAPGTVTLQHPADPFQPGMNTLDLRHRRTAQLRPQACLRIGFLAPLSYQLQQQWEALLASLPVLCPTLRGEVDGHPVHAAEAEALADYDLLFSTEQTLTQWQNEARSRELGAIQQFLREGGTLLITASHKTTALKTLLGQLTNNAHFSAVDAQHPLKQKPFRFGQLPVIGESPIELFYGAGVVVAMGGLGEAWSSESLPRHHIRDAQELGVNLLSFAQQRRYFSRLMG